MTYSDKLYKALQYSHEEAERLGHTEVMPEHLMLGIIRNGEGKAVDMLRYSGIDLQEMKQQIEKLLPQPKQGATSIPAAELHYNRQAERILRILDLEQRAFHSEISDTEHLLLALLKERMNKVATTLTERYGITYDSIAQLYPKMQTQPKASAGFTADEDLEDPEDDAPKKTTTAKKKKTDTPALDSYGNDLTAAAAEGKLDPVIGRDKEIERVVQILARRKKNNPILIGEPGVGKSAIVEGLAMRIHKRTVSPTLFEKRIIMLDMSSLVAGTKYRGQFEERMQAIMRELQEHHEIILFIDEIHTIIGAGNQAGQLDAANMLKPALARGEVQCIGATTTNEYRTSIEKDGALERRFQKVMVEPTTAEETLQILKQIAPAYQAHHGVEYTDEVLEACVKLTDRYLTDRVFPDKAIDAMDEVGARRHVQMPFTPLVITELENELQQCRKEKDKVLQEQNFEQAVIFRDKERTLQGKLKIELQKWEDQRIQQPDRITTDDVAHIVSLMSGVPVEKIATEENVRLREMASTLEQKVIGQDEAVRTIVRSIQRSRVGLKDPNRPIGTFLLLGPTGVGKTYLAQCLAEEMFGSRNSLIRLDMSEYMEKHAVSLLVGAPPGYVGHEDAGKLTEAVRRKPYSIVLFDEIEKAHPDIFNILLQVLDEGRLTDRQGHQVDFKNTIIMMTSNVGTRQLKEFGQGIGFSMSNGINDKDAKAVLRRALDKTFAPEFINRIDNIVTFNQLEKESISKILDLELNHLVVRLSNLGYTMQLSEAARELLMEKGYDKQYGARPMKRVIQNEVEDALTEFLLMQPADNKADLQIDASDGKIKITQK